MTFRDLNLNSTLINALDELGFDTPTPIQEKTFSVAMSGKDIVGIAQTGTGKTLAFLLPSLRLHKFSKKKQPTILVVVPTRELVFQVVERIEELTQYMTIRVLGVYGGANINTQKQDVWDGCDILVATPGRLMDLALSGVLRLKDVKRFIIDEMDELLSLGFRPQLLNIMDMLPEKRQNLMFSATITNDVENFIEKFFVNPVKIEAAGAGTPLSLINQTAFEVPNFLSKANYLVHLLEQKNKYSKVMVFVSSKRFADLLFEKMDELFPEEVGVIHSNKSQNNRINSVRSFDAGEIRILIATDVIARGIDINEVTQVINFHLPETPEFYTHRIGRTGRADKRGEAISFIGDTEKLTWEAIAEHTKKQIKFSKLPEEVELTSELLPVEQGKDEADINYLPQVTKASDAGPAFHERSEKNQKWNKGGSYRRKIKEKYKKPKTRGQKPRGGKSKFD